MKVIKLTSDYKEKTKHLFSQRKFAGIDAHKMEKHMAQWTADIPYDQWAHEAFCNTYLSDLTSFHAYGLVDEDGNVHGVTTIYESDKEPSWYYIMCRTNGQWGLVRILLQGIIEDQESKGRYKFFTAFNARHGRALRGVFFTEETNERYDYFDEVFVPAQTKCYYQMFWEILYGRSLMPVDTVVRCTFLKREYRPTQTIGGGM